MRMPSSPVARTPLPRGLWRVLPLAAVCLVANTTAAAGPFRRRATLRIDRVEVDKPPQVRVHLTDLDRNGKPITDRKGQLYRLLVDGVPQSGASKVQRAEKLGAPVAMTLVIQVSPALRDVLTEAVESSKRLIDALPPNSKVGLVAYTDVVVTEIKPTKPTKVKSAVDDLRIREEGVEVQLLDALRDSLEGLDNPKLPKQRMVVVLSDGLTAKLNFRDFTSIGRRAREKGVTMHSVGYAPLEPARLRTLYELSRRGGGTFRQTGSGSQLRSAIDDLIDELKQQRVLTYKAPKFFDGKLHDFQIELPGGQASNIVAMELPKHTPEETSDEQGVPAWMIFAAVGGGVVLLTVLTVVLLRIRARPKPAPARPRYRAYDDEEDDEQEEDDEDDEEEEDDELGYAADEPPGRRAPKQAGGWSPPPESATPAESDASPAAERSRRDMMMPNDPRASIDALFDARTNPGQAPPATTIPPGAVPPQQQFPPAGSPRAHEATSVASAEMLRSLPGGAGRTPPATGAGAPAPQPMQAPPVQPQPAQPESPAAPQAVQNPLMPAAPGGSAPGLPGAPQQPVAPAPAAQQPSPPTAGAPNPGPVAGGGFRLPLPDPDEFVSRGGAAPPSNAPVAAPAAPPAGAPPGAAPGGPAGPAGGLALPSPEDFLRQQQGGASPAGANPLSPMHTAQAPQSGSPAPSTGGVMARSGIQLDPASAQLVGMMPVPNEDVQAGHLLNRKTMVLAVEELASTDFVGWLVRIDVGDLTPVVLRDGLTIGSDPSSDYPLSAPGVLPQHARVRLDASGFQLETVGAGGERTARPLADDDRFRLGEAEFLFKMAANFPLDQVSPARLEVLDGLDQGRSTPLPEGVVSVLGSHESCDLVVRGPTVAKRHAVALRKQQECIIADLGAESGVVAGGTRRGYHRLKPGEEVVLGDIRLIYTLELSQRTG